MKHMVFASLCALLTVGAWAQTVTVDATDGSPDNVTTFNSLMLAIHSFQATGEITAASPANVGVNNGNGAANVINIANSSPIDEEVRIDETSISQNTSIQDEALTINGPGSGAPSAANNAVVRPQIDEGATDNDGFVVICSQNVTVNNVTFIPSSLEEIADDLIRVNSVTAGPVTIDFNSCVLTSSDAAGNPVVNDKAEAIIDNTGIIVNVPDDLVNVGAAASDELTIEFNDCILSHNEQASGRDGIVETAVGPRTTAAFNLNIDSSVITYIGRYGIQLAGDGGVAPTQWNLTISGANVDAGPVAGLGGPTIIANCINNAFMSFLGTDTGTADVSHLIMGNNGIRCWSSEADIQEVSFHDVLAYQASPGVCFVQDGWTDQVPHDFDNVTLVGEGAWGDPIDVGPPPVNTFDGCIFAGDDGNNALGTLFSGNYNITFDDSALVQNGPNASVGAPNPGYTPGASVISFDPTFLSFDPYNPSFLDVDNNNYAVAGPGGVPLRGGATYIGSTPVELSIFSTD